MRQHMEKMLKYRTRVFVDSETDNKPLHGSLTSQDVPQEGKVPRIFSPHPCKTSKVRYHPAGRQGHRSTNST